MRRRIEIGEGSKTTIEAHVRICSHGCALEVDHRLIHVDLAIPHGAILVSQGKVGTAVLLEDGVGN